MQLCQAQSPFMAAVVVALVGVAVVSLQLKAFMIDAIGKRFCPAGLRTRMGWHCVSFVSLDDLSYSAISRDYNAHQEKSMRVTFPSTVGTEAAADT